MLVIAGLLGGFIYLARDWIIDTVQNAVVIIKLVVESVTIPPVLAPHLPTALSVCMTFVVGVTVVKIIFMRGGQN